MELPFNTVYSADILGNKIETPVADWPTKRAWVDYAFTELASAGYSVSSAYTMVKDASKVNFSYRDNLWMGSDLLATGVASFGHASGVHYQNLADLEKYYQAIDQDRLPLGRGYVPTAHQLLVRQMILLLKRGYLDVNMFREKFGVDIRTLWAAQWEKYVQAGWVVINGDSIELTREGLLRADALLPAFFEPEHQGVRYT
jgi:oxygen-independent coproporphyrinogen-3 oxidase